MDDRSLETVPFSESSKGHSSEDPFMAIPVEIITEIFTQFLPRCPKRPFLVGRRSPLLLAQVCRLWRDVALTTHVLWSSFILFSDVPDRRAHEKYLLDLWLQRSGDLPLSISLKFPNRTKPSALGTALVETVLQHASRWQEVHLNIPYEDFLGIPCPMPLLRSLTVAQNGIPDPELPAISMQAPNLTEVTISSPHGYFPITLPWGQLTTLTATIYEYDAVQIFRSAAALETCTLTVIHHGADPSTALRTPAPPLLKLRSLKLSCQPHRTRLHNLLRTLGRLPALEILSTTEFLLPARDPVAALRAMCRDASDLRQIEVLNSSSSRSGLYKAAFPHARVFVHRDVRRT
ncbi:hypothetical protein FB45DRAFT_896155 [Roridomyces roridus]|uniref:F-box domain-containing protein n=1 Tax=Roridomyces roridus TaxID=1738132 RepID=A0AAD7CAC4_9AGAR|nr:hypothetical protein FB45DRAFT_896155 [Roridomyces roridus]